MQSVTSGFVLKLFTEKYSANLFVDFGELFQIVLQENDLLFQSQAASCVLRVQLYILSKRQKEKVVSVVKILPR